MAVNELLRVRQEYEQAKRNVRRIAQERLCQQSVRLDRLYYDARDRVDQIRAELTQLERLEATRPDGAETRHPT